jgi:tRNA 2-thiouridine synthesizing protein A
MTRNLALVQSAENNGKIHFDHEIDVRGLSCPLPILSTRKSLDILNNGEVLKVISNDKGCVNFFESMVRQTGLELLSWNEQEGEFRFFLRKP